MNSYSLTRRWFDFAFVTKEAKAYHTALFCWIVELNNRLGWKPEFGLPTQDTMEGLSIGNKKTYKDTLKDLAGWGFIEVVQESKNQYQACIIKICRGESEPAPVSALDNSMICRSESGSGIGSSTGTTTDTGTGISIGSSTVPIDKPINNKTNKHLVVVEFNAEAEKTTAAQLEDTYQDLKASQEEKEKSSGQKEKIFPTLDEATAKISTTAHWRNAKDHHSLTDENRTDLFKIFYEMKEDNYRIRYPSVNDMASNFYFWVKTYQNREIIQKLNQHAVATSQANNTTNNRYGRTAANDKRAELRALKDKSASFLRQSNGTDHQEYPNG